MPDHRATLPCVEDWHRRRHTSVDLRGTLAGGSPPRGAHSRLPGGEAWHRHASEGSRKHPDPGVAHKRTHDLHGLRSADVKIQTFW